jgi:hypothetical protein
MNKFVKNISVSFLLIAGLAIIAHSIIPHDHHQAELSAIQGDTCPLSENTTGHKTGHHQGFPVHCHAFNDLASEKFIIYCFSKVTQINLTTGGLVDPSAGAIHYTWIALSDILQPLQDSHYLDLSSLRAPPTVI